MTTFEAGQNYFTQPTQEHSVKQKGFFEECRRTIEQNTPVLPAELATVVRLSMDYAPETKCVALENFPDIFPTDSAMRVIF